MDVKLLLDENLSPYVALTLCREGLDVAHVRDRGLQGSSDAEVFAAALSEDRVVVTANVCDFVSLAKHSDLHGGVVLLEDGQLIRAEQEKVIRQAIDLIARERDMVNRVLHISHSGEHQFETLRDS